jgi:hypothetical protein
VPLGDGFAGKEVLALSHRSLPFKLSVVRCARPMRASEARPCPRRLGLAVGVLGVLGKTADWRGVPEVLVACARWASSPKRTPGAGAAAAPAKYPTLLANPGDPRVEASSKG